ncbi:MAG: universal stress protein [Polaromonas sp.]|nr:universal stress protein [Polaromonas sp.]
MLKILIAVDGSEHADRAIEAVGHMARSSVQLEATLLSVSPKPLIYGGPSEATLKKFEEEQKKQQTATLEKAMAHARAQGLTPGEPARAHGAIAHEIVRVAKDQQFDQIVMGTRGMGAITGILMGSVSQQVVSLSPLPVLLVK